MLNITILCSDENHPFNPYLHRWIDQHKASNSISLCRRKIELPGGDLLLLISCSELIGVNDRLKYGATLVLHASDLPVGRGWSPHVWQLAQGASEITISLLEADEKVDSGAIWKKIVIPIPKHCLWNEINNLLFEAELELMSYAVHEHKFVVSTIQDPNQQGTYFRKRTPADSEIDPNKSIAEQFDLIRVCDPNRFPAFFVYHGHKYKLVLEKLNES